MSTMTTTTSLNLPCPADRPNASIVLFDGQCKFCRGGVQRLSKFDTGGRLAYLSLHDPEVAVRFPHLTHEQLMEEMYVIEPNGQQHRGAGAVRYLSRALPWLWWLAPLMHVPFSLPLWQAGYRWVAGQRYRWGKIDDCESGSCAVHFGPSKGNVNDG